MMMCIWVVKILEPLLPVDGWVCWQLTIADDLKSVLCPGDAHPLSVAPIHLNTFHGSTKIWNQAQNCLLGNCLIALFQLQQAGVMLSLIPALNAGLAN